MMDVGRHPKVKLLAYSEIEDISGYVGNFKVRIRKKARYVDETQCTSCGDCVEVCPVVIPDEYQVGLGSRRAIFLPFPQAVPSAYIVNANECLGQNPIACGKCIEACEKGCIDFAMGDEIIQVDVAWLWWLPAWISMIPHRWMNMDIPVMRMLLPAWSLRG